jgi:hypothetical protein
VTAELRALLELFYDEAVEHLTDIETVLQTLDPRAPDPGGLELMFRAARSATASAHQGWASPSWHTSSEYSTAPPRPAGDAGSARRRLAGERRPQALLAAHRGTGWWNRPRRE